MSRLEAEAVLPLLARVKPIAGESLLSLLARSAEANGIERLGEITAFAEVSASAPAFLPFTIGTAFNGLAQVMSVSAEDISVRTHPRSNPQAAWSGSVDLIDWYGTPIERKFVEASSCRVAPAALSASPHHRAEWMLRPICVSTETFEFLRSDCERCGAGIGWSRTIGVARCGRCGAALGDQRTQLLTFDLRPLATRVGALVSHDVAVRRRVISGLPAPFRSWEAGAIFEAAFEFGIAWNVTHEGKSQKSIRLGRRNFEELPRETILDGMRLIENWPTSLVDLVSRRWSDRQGVAGSQARMRLGNLGKFLGPALGASPLGVALIEAIGPAIRSARIAVRGGAIPSAAELPTHEIVSEKEAAQVFNVSQQILRRITLASGTLLVKEKKVSKLFDRRKLGQGLQSLRSALSTAQVAAQIGIPSHVVPGLSHAKLIENELNPVALDIAGSDRIYTKESVLNLVSVISATAVPHQFDPVVLGDFLQGEAAPSVWTKFIQAMLDGYLLTSPSVAHSLCEHKVKTLMVDRSKAAELRSQIGLVEIEGHLEVNATTAGEIMAISDVYVGKLVSEGQIQAFRSGRALMMSLRDVQTFGSRWVTTGELCKRSGLSLMIVRDALKGFRLQPGMKVYKYHFWERAAAEDALQLQPLSAYRSWPSPAQLAV